MSDPIAELRLEARKGWSLLPAPEKAIAALVGVLAALLLVYTVLSSKIDWFGLTKKRADAAEVQAKTSQQQSNLATNTVHIIEKYTTTERVVTQRAEDQAHAVQAIPSDDLPAAVRDGWVAGLRDIDASALDHHRSTNAP